MAEKDLEKVLKKKIKPIIDEATHRFLGVTIGELGKDITDSIEKNPLLSYEIDTSISFKEAKNKFKKQFLAKQIQTHYGNVSALAKALEVDRRSMQHQNIKML